VLRAVDLVIIFLAVANTVHEKAQVKLVLWLLPTVLVTQSLVYFAESALGMTFELNGDLVEQAGAIGRHGGTVGVAAAGFASFIHPLMQYALASFLAADRTASRTCPGGNVGDAGVPRAARAARRHGVIVLARDGRGESSPCCCVALTVRPRYVSEDGDAFGGNAADAEER
jgi:hypothetical protein